MAKFTAQNLGLKQVAVLKDLKSDYSVGLAEFFEKPFTSLGGQIVANESYSEGDTEFRGQRWFRTLFLIPYAMPVYVAVIAWSFMLDRDNGALNALLGDLHLIGDTPPFWLMVSAM